MHLAIAITIPLAAAACLIASLAGFLLLRRRITLRLDPENSKLNSTIAHFIDEPKNKSPKYDILTSPPRRFTWPEIQSATANFTTDIVGKGGFSTVYFARLTDSTAASVKLHQSSERLHRAFRSELNILLRLHHPHIVRLLGYCDEQDNQGVLIFEFISNGSLHEKLNSNSVLPWARRTSIAYRLAQALDYLHEGCELQIVHGDIKASNVLLDGDLNPKLCDFGCACMGFSSAVRPPGSMTGSPGYVDPHYIRTGMVSKKSDVYSFGVLMLVMITGAEAFDVGTERVLAAEVSKVVREADGGKLSKIVDRRLAGEYDEGEVEVMAAISALCIGENPSLRPSMADVVAMMEEKVASAISGGDCKR